MNLPFSNAAVADHYAVGTVAKQDWWLTSRGDSRATLLCLTLLIATLWMATRPYMGVIHDSRFYTVQALSALLPGRFASDLYFRYGSQDQFTSFTLIYKPVLAALGIAKAAMVLTIVGQVCWIAGLIYLARGLFQDGRTALLAVATAVALPGGVLLSYGEQFLTPRLIAEAITLWAFGSMLRGRPILALFLLGVSATVHPLMTLPGLAVLFFHEAAGRRIWWVLGAFAVIASLGLAAAGVQPFVRLSERFDPAWFDVVRVRDFFCLLTKWTIVEWLQTCGMFTLGALALSLAEPLEKRFLLAVLAVAFGGLLVTLLGGDLLHDVLIVDAQQYRATWPLAVAGNLFIGPLLMRVRGNLTASVTGAAVTCAAVMLIMTMFVKVGYFFAVPMLILASIAAAWERYQRNFASRPIAVLEVVIVASVCGTSLVVLYEYMEWIKDVPSLFWQTIRGLGLSVAALGAVTVLVTVPTSTHKAVIRPSIGFAIGLAFVAALGWDERTPWTKFIETTDPAPQSLSALLPEQKSIYWEGDERVPWFVLRRASYFSCAQGTGALFFRGAALSYQHRYESLQQLGTLDFGQETGCPLPPAPGPVSYNRDELASICAKAPELGALVLTRPIADAVEHVWTSPVQFEDVRPIDGKWRIFTTNRFFVYSCADFR